MSSWCKPLLTAFLFWWTVSSKRARATSPALCAGSAAWTARLSEESNGKTPCSHSTSMDVCAEECAGTGVGGGRWRMCACEMACICSTLVLEGMSRNFSTPTLPVYKSKLQMLTNILGKYFSHCPSCMRNSPSFTFCSLCYENNRF